MKVKLLPQSRASTMKPSCCVLHVSPSRSMADEENPPAAGTIACTCTYCPLHTMPDKGRVKDDGVSDVGSRRGTPRLGGGSPGAALQRRHGIGLSEFRALRQLTAANDGELRMQELADLVGLNQSSVSRLVLRMEATDMTRRDHCPDDRRGGYTVITDEGRARLADADPTYEATLRDSLEKAAADHQFSDLVALLRSP